MLHIFDFSVFFSFISVFFSLIAYFIYYKSIISWDTNPHLYSWLLWGLITVTVWIIQVSDSAWIWSLNTFLVWFLCLWIAYLAYKKWDKDITLSDKIYLFLWIISIFLWIFIDNPFYSVILLILIDIFWFIPTFKKLFENPYKEDVLTYFLSFFWYWFSILSLQNFTFITCWYVFLTAIFNLSLFTMVLVRRRWVDLVI